MLVVIELFAVYFFLYFQELLAVVNCAFAILTNLEENNGCAESAALNSFQNLLTINVRRRGKRLYGDNFFNNIQRSPLELECRTCNYDGEYPKFSIYT